MIRTGLLLALVVLFTRVVLAQDQSGDFVYCGSDVLNRVSVGMSAPEVLAECPRPYDRTQVATANGMREKWTYRADSGVGAVYFHDGQVTAVEN